jgi:serine/threonine protein kinase/tetratricopeptide (TPR) repeat protein
MDSVRWQRVQKLFEGALSVAQAERKAYLQAGVAEEDVLNIVNRMLRADAGEGSLLDRAVSEMASELLLPQDDSAEPPIEEFGPYRLIRLLGEGGMGVVWLAERIDTGGQVAVKFLLNAGLSPARLERFTQEARLLAKLKHRCIARLYDAGTLGDGTPWFVMEYVAGTRFTEFCRNLNSLEKKLQLFRAVCEAVQSAHDQEIIHRDLKPSNILVEGDGTPKLLDFGIARELQQAGDQSGLTVRGPRFMSRHYSAPEWINDAAVSFKTDVYSLGVMLYEMLTGQLPDSGEAYQTGEGPEAEGTMTIKPSSVVAKLTRNFQFDTEKRINSLRVTRSEWNDLDVLCLRAMHPNPLMRYSSVEALVREIDHFMRGEPLEARPDSLSYHASKFVRRNARAVLLTSAVILLVVIMSVVFVVRLAHARNAAVAEAARADRVRQFTLALFRSSGQFVDSPNNLTVEMFADRGVVDADKLTQDPTLQAELFQILGQMYEGIGKPPKAASLYFKALALLDKQPDAPVSSLVNARLRLYMNGDREKSQSDRDRLIQDAMSIAKQRAPGDLALRARIDTLRGGSLSDQGRYHEAEQTFKSVVQMLETSGGATEELADALLQLSNVEQSLPNCGDSDSASKKLITVAGALHRSNDPVVGEALLNLGECAELHGRYAPAESYERQALSITQAWYGKDHRRAANKMSALALTLIEEKKFSEASALLHSALAIEQQAYAPNSLFISKTLKNLGMLHLATGENTAAINTFERVLAIYRSHVPDDSYLPARLFLFEGQAYRQRDNLSVAESLLRKALKTLVNVRGENDVYTARARLELGRTLLQKKHYEEAEVQLRTGIAILQSQSMEQTNLMQAAHKDLIAVDMALHAPPGTVDRNE